MEPDEHHLLGESAFAEMKERMMVKNEEQVELVQRLFLQHMSELRAWVYTMIRDLDLTNDVVQETFLTVYKKADQFEKGSNFRAWVYAIGRLKILEASRRPAVREVAFAEDVLELLMPKENELADNSDRLSQLKSCILKLSPTSRQAVVLRYMDAMKPPAIAQIMKWSVNAINVTLSRARIALKECILKHEMEDSFSQKGLAGK
ncbi:MAG: sigma-70 family RNA polymerase sigma factor [Opitutales bacterium]|nr:sigma-70 family RNA polymerase sigma factor [Opitutales bacterium]